MSDEQLQMIEDCEKRESKLSRWEYEFIVDISDNGSLTKKQSEKLEAIWERVTA